MEEILDFFNISKEFKRKIAPVPKPILEPPCPANTGKVGYEHESPDLLCKKKRKLEVGFGDQHSQVNSHFDVLCEEQHSYGHRNASAEQDLAGNLMQKEVNSNSESIEDQHSQVNRHFDVCEEQHSYGHSNALAEQDLSENLMKEEVNSDSDSIEDQHSHGHRHMWAENQLPEIVMQHEDDESNEDTGYSYLNIYNGVYERYRFNLERDKSLPIYDFKDEILETIRKSSVVILQGETGCGKSTQVPQYLLDDAYRGNEYCKIICTQPRRIAAISVATRVCIERELDEGTVVGYQVGLHANMSDDTRLLYCTTGVLLQKLIKNKTLLPYTHIILDEVHERDLDMDFLLIIIRRLLLTNSRNVKIILMSATIDTKVFSEYFRIRKQPAPVIRADSRRLFQVQEFYLCDLESVNNQNAEVNALEPGISREMFSLALKLIIVIRDIEDDEISVNAEAYKNLEKPSILIFLPGMSEIDLMYKVINELCQIKSNNINIWCLRLHSVISPDEQYNVFHSPPPGYRKVILATNIAESSITVPDVKYVIDFCLVKLLVTDTLTNLTTLQLNWASKTNCRQRAGRAGRVMNGRVYRLVPRSFYNNVLDEFSIPEMLRCPLESIVLKAKLLDMGSPSEVLSLALSPPNINQIENTILTLKEVGGLYKTTDGIYRTDDGDLSFVGRIMANLPLDIKLTRLIVFGYVFGDLEDSIIMAAGLNVRSIFKSCSPKIEEQEKAFVQKMDWANGTGSDPIAILRAYKEWLIRSKDEEAEILWAKSYMIHLPSIREMHLLIADLKSRLSAFKFQENNICECFTLEKDIILKLIIAGAFYPNYFLYSKLYDPDRERRDIGEVYGRNLCRTVYFTNFNKSHIGQLYTRSIKDLFKVVNIHPRNIDVCFPPNSERVLVMFRNDLGLPSINTPGSVCFDLYKALRIRYLNSNTSINVMEPFAGRKYAEAYGLGAMKECVWVPSRRIANNFTVPSVFQKDISGVITYIKHCSQFYFQPLSQRELIGEINEMISNPFDIESCKFTDPSALTNGMILAALFENSYHRGKVRNIIRHSGHVTHCEILFMDYGNTDIVNFRDLRYLSDTSKYLTKIPPTIFECRLAMIDPSALKSSHSQWTDEAMKYLQHHTNSGLVEIEVFSVVDGVANIIIKTMNSTINDQLVEKGLARTSEESLKSKMDHDLRIQKQSVAKRLSNQEMFKQNKEYLHSIRTEVDVDFKPPPIERCTKTIRLEGPFSPLESPLRPAVRAVTWKSVVLERESINYMNIDSDPKDMYERLIVATNMTEAQNGNAVIARHTTIMPNIHGFGALMTMLFCPTMQIKRNMTRTKYVTVLAGLGFDEETGKPLYEEHDVVLTLDVGLFEDDIALINEIRLYMDCLLHTDPDQDKPNINRSEMQKLTTALRHLVLRLLSKQRKYIEIHEDSNDNKWEKFQKPMRTTAFHDNRSLFPIHKPMPLYEEEAGHIDALNTHCHELHNLRECERAMKPIKCRLCDQPINNVTQLRIHLHSQLHRDREQQIRFQPASS